MGASRDVGVRNGGTWAPTLTLGSAATGAERECGPLERIAGI